MLLSPLLHAVERDGKIIEIAFDDVIRYAPYTLIFFYSKDGSSACTKEMLAFASIASDLESMGVMLMGVSRDNITRKQKIHQKHALPYLLLSDPDKLIHTKFQTLKESIILGREKVERSSFLLSSDGEIVHEWRGIKKAEKHPQEVLEIAKNLCTTHDEDSEAELDTLFDYSINPDD